MVAGDVQLAHDAVHTELLERYKGLRCVKCKKVPWPAWWQGGWAIRCLCGPDRTYLPGDLEQIGNWLKEKLADMIERQTKPETMLARVDEAHKAGLFPQNCTDQQLAMVSKVATAYNLDPVMGELIIYQGKPYIARSLAGRKFRVTGYPTTVFLDSDGGHVVNVPGYVPADRFLVLLKYIGEGYFKRGVPFDEFAKKFVTKK